MTLQIEDADEYGVTAYSAEARWEDAPDGSAWRLYDVRPDPPPNRYSAVLELFNDEIARQERGADTGRD